MQTTSITTSIAPRASAPPGLLANAALSLAVGALLAGAPGVVGGWLGLEIDGWLRLLGLGLLVHAVALGAAARHHGARRWTKRNLAMIAPYPLLMVGVAASGLVETGLGRALVLVDGLAVGAVAVMQWRGLRHDEPARDPRAS